MPYGVTLRDLADRRAQVGDHRPWPGTHGSLLPKLVLTLKFAGLTRPASFMRQAPTAADAQARVDASGWLSHRRRT